MSDGYPEEQELKKIKEWDYKDFPGLMGFVKGLWSYPQYWNETHADNHTIYEISTGGWSGNEDLIAALMVNRMFWVVCWLSSRRGGCYEFEVKDKDNE